MASRHRSRIRALQLLYQIDMRKLPVEEALSAYYDNLLSEESETGLPELAEKAAPPRRKDRFMEELVEGTMARAAEVNALMEKHAQHWRPERMPTVDRNILRLAIYELLKKDSPPAVVIDEALELARRFAGDDSIGFVNGILDAVRKEV
ncbi:MAG: transcription antitermination factor NusB, partial [Acidobacteria bacterium]|nr:transcription antitermination factor NusB [Acidobacteriota bacterium]